jgi:hypothetical protein
MLDDFPIDKLTMIIIAAVFLLLFFFVAIIPKEGYSEEAQSMQILAQKEKLHKDYSTYCEIAGNNKAFCEMRWIELNLMKD